MSGCNDLDQIRVVHNTGFNVDNLKQERNVMLSNTENYGMWRYGQESIHMNNIV